MCLVFVGDILTNADRSLIPVKPHRGRISNMMFVPPCTRVWGSGLYFDAVSGDATDTATTVAAEMGAS